MTNRFFAAVSLFTLYAATASAQLATTTSLVGNVVDPTGKSVQNAKVTAVETGTADTRTTTTNEQGYYSFEFARVGVYSVTVELARLSEGHQDGNPGQHQPIRPNRLHPGDRRSHADRDGGGNRHGHQDRRRHRFRKHQHPLGCRFAAEVAAIRCGLPLRHPE